MSRLTQEQADVVDQFARSLPALLSLWGWGFVAGLPVLAGRANDEPASAVPLIVLEAGRAPRPWSLAPTAPGIRAELWAFPFYDTVIYAPDMGARDRIRLAYDDALRAGVAP